MHVLSMTEYAKLRGERRKAIVEAKRHRRVEVGPVAVFLFESYDTMWLQVHEMLYIEQGGEEQVPGELEAYNPLIPKGRELVATIMFQIDEPERRKTFLSRLGGVEETAFLRFDGEEIVGRPEEDVDRTTADGKASSVQFVHFQFSDEQAAKFERADCDVILGFAHPAYSHMAVMPEDVRASLADDFD